MPASASSLRTDHFLREIPSIHSTRIVPILGPALPLNSVVVQDLKSSYHVVVVVV